ncbi:MAG: S8 family serine peptidase [Armatimonadota bacterium]
MRARMFCVLVTFVLLTGFSIGAVSDPVTRQFVAGELIVSLNPNGGADQLQQLAQQMDLTVDYLGVPGVYHLIMKGAKEGTVSEMQTLETVQKLKDTGLFAYVGPNKLYYSLQREVRPNDPRYGEQWGLEMINMPRAWVFQKGKANVIVAVVDSGVDMNHPDLKGRLLPGRDTADQDNDPNPPGNDLVAGHGTHVAGIVGATTNNGIGIAGVTWEGVQILPVKASPNSGIGAYPQDALIRAVQFCIDQKANVVNMSLGGPDVSDTPNMADPFNQLVISATQQGIVFVMSAGNSYLEGNPPFYPANLASVSDMVLAVAAVGPRREHAVYSEARPYTTVAAPGGNGMATRIETDDILSTLPGGNYAYNMGTSMAAPHAAGAVAILLSQGVKPADVKKLLQDTAAADGRSVPNPEFGYGIIDVYNAIRRVATSAAVVSPAAAEVVETLKPTLVFSVTNTTPALVTIAIDGQVVTSTEIADNYVPAPDGIVATIKIARRLAPGTHTVKITAKNAIDSTIASSDEITFQVSPYVLRAGRSLISIPYFQPQTGQLTRSVPAETMLGTGFQMFRWMPQGRYAKYSSWGAPKDPAASFDQTTEQVGPEGGNTMAPLGLAYFVDLPTDTPVLTEGTPAPEVPYRIPLKAGWNMVGNPFAFNVPWVACEVETIADVRLSLQEAVDKNIILPQLYRYEGGVYTWQTAPAGDLYKWEGFWVRVFEDCTLIVMPLPTGGRSVPVDATLSGGGWLLRLSAVAGNARDGNTIIGVNSRAADGYGREDVPKPPSISPYVSVKVVNPDWGLHAGAYAQDVRRSDRRQTWQLQVETDQVNEPVTLRWERLTDVPPRVRLTLVDNVTGKRVAMRTTGSYAYQPGGVGTRSFTVIAETDMGSALRISSVRVRATRGSGFAIDYALSAEAQVQITITDASGKPVASLVQSTRSAGLNSATWNGRDSKGVVVPAGSYLVRIEATSTDGERTRMITPVVITR